MIGLIHDDQLAIHNLLQLVKQGVGRALRINRMALGVELFHQEHEKLFGIDARPRLDAHAVQFFGKPFGGAGFAKTNWAKSVTN